MLSACSEPCDMPCLCCSLEHFDQHRKAGNLVSSSFKVVLELQSECLRRPLPDLLTPFPPGFCLSISLEEVGLCLRCS